MSIPTITDILGGHLFTWAEEELVIKSSRCRAHSSDGRVTGEISISDLTGKPLYPQTSLNFCSERTRTQLAKTLMEQDCDRPWQDIINQVSLAIVERTRLGEPVRELWTSDDVPELEYLLKPILIKGVPTIIFGEKGVTKSTMSLVFYACLILPWKDNLLGLEVPSRSVKALILDYELPGYIAQRNAKNFQEGMGLPAFPLYHRRCSSPLANDLEQVQNYINETGAEVVIVDSLARACGGDLNKTPEANAFFESLDKLNITSLILAQTSKDIESKRKTIFGSSLFTYYSRNIFELCKSDNLADEDSINVGLFHRDSNLTRLHPDMGFKISFNGAKTVIESQPISVAEFKAKVNIQKAIIEELKTSGLLSPKELSENINASENTIKVVLSKLKKRNIVINPERGKWGLPT